MDDQVYSQSSEKNSPEQIREPETAYTVRDDRFEQDWQRGLTIEEFRKRLYDKLGISHD